MDNNDGWKEVGGGQQYEMWDENADNTIEGKYVDVRRNVGKNNANVYALELADGSKKGIWGSTVLDSKFENIQIGSLVRIRYLGKNKGKEARGEYKDYQVFTRAPGDQPATAGATTQSKDDLPF